MESKPSESGLFQLPSLPPWKTPRCKNNQNQQQNRNNYTTPLRKSSTLLVYHSQQEQQLQDEEDYQDSELNIQIPSIKEEKVDGEMEYKYYALSEKALLRESKVRDFLHSERAVHCLIFHKNAHLDDMNTYRPDLERDCGELDDPDNTEEHRALLQSVPGCTKQDLNVLLNKDYMLQRPNVRRIDEILNHEVNALKRFWNDSELASTLERNHLHEQYVILQQEQKEIAHIKRTLQAQSGDSINDKYREICSKN